MSNPPVGRLGKYEVQREIARGSMGTVYLGHDLYIDRPVALKVAHSDQLDDEESGDRYRKMFFNEAHTAGRLSHPNIISIYDAGVEGETCYIVAAIRTATLALAAPARLLGQTAHTAQRDPLTLHQPPLARPRHATRSEAPRHPQRSGCA